ncbi:MAG: DNA-3-methyladenine glycosylase [Actinomycetota bacterium]
MRTLSRSFFARPTLQVAESLIGRTLYRLTGEGLVSGRIVETEAYCGTDDPSSHAFKGPTPRSAIMFGPPGHLYVYLSYGMHHCANIVAHSSGRAGAVLLRAVEPAEGKDLMAQRRGVDSPMLLARGPGRLCRAFAVSLADNGADLTAGAISIGARRVLRAPIARSARVGLRAGMDQPWRFYEPGPWTSRP